MTAMWIQRAADSLVGGAAAALDRAATLAARTQSARGRRRSAESLGHADRMRLLGALAQRYAEVPRERHFRPARPIDPQAEPVRDLPDGGRAVDLRWPSAYETLLPEIQRRYDERGADNRIAAARMLQHAEPRPLAILLHGYMSGHYGVEERMWPVQWLYRIGLDCALFVLPFHGVRAVPGRRGPPAFPSSDPRLSNEGFRQAVSDLVDLVAWARSRGHRGVGVMGMSLGGYAATLAATVDASLDFVVPVIPLASLADFAFQQRRLGAKPEEAHLEHAALDVVHRITSPLHRPPRLPAERILVVGARADRITPLHHAERLAAHFGAPLEVWSGGHLLQYGRSAAFRRVGRMLGALGWTDPRPPR